MPTSPVVPTDEQVKAAAQALRDRNPELGRAKILAQLREDNHWSLSEARLKKLVPAASVNETKANAATSSGANTCTKKSTSSISSSSNSYLGPPVLPENALAVQEWYKDNSTRCFKIYGRGEYDFGVTLNSDMAITIDICHQRLAKLSKKGWNDQALKANWPHVERIWDFYCAAGRIAGVSKDDLGRQMEAEYSINPVPIVDSDSGPTAKMKEERRRAFKEQSLKLKKVILSTNPDAAKYIKVDARGEPIWDDRINGEFTVIVVKIDKGNGLKEFGSVEFDPSTEKPGQSILRWI
jgi:hypothetical protein